MKNLSVLIAEQHCKLNQIKAEAKAVADYKKQEQEKLEKLVERYEMAGDTFLSNDEIVELGLENQKHVSQLNFN